jgi:hypothetical protein
MRSRVLASVNGISSFVSRSPRLMAGAPALWTRGPRGVAASILGRDRLPRQALDIAQQIALIGVAQRDGDARGAGACRASDAMDVAFGHVWKLVVHHMCHLIDVDAASGNVGCNQHPDLRRAKRRQRPFALRLALIAVDGRDPKSGRV